MTILRLELRNMRRGAVISTLAICGTIFLLLAFFPSMQTESMKALAGAKMEGMDSAILAAFGLSKMMDFTIISNYFGYSLQYISLGFAIVVTQRAISLLIKEESQGTIEYLCAKPVSRQEIFSQKILAHFLVLCGSIFVMHFITTISYLAFSEYSLGEALRENAIFYGGLLFAGSIYSALGILFSVLLKEGGSTTGIALGMVFGSFIAGIVSGLVEKLKVLIWLSPLDWIKSQKILTDGILLEEWIVGVVIVVAALFVAGSLYNKKDLLI